MAEKVKYITEANFQQEISQGNVLVDFSAEWCGPCKALGPVLEKVATSVAGTATVVKLDIDEAQQTAATFQVTSVPTMILFKNGKESGRLVGLRDQNAIEKFILTT